MNIFINVSLILSFFWFWVKYAILIIMKKEIITNSAKEMKWLGKEMAKEIIKTEKKKALIIGMEGDLGSGKTTFIQGVAKGLGIKEKITSPSFVILKKYKIPKTARCFVHIDCYRIKSDDLLELGFEEIAENPQNIIVIEWAERAKKILKDAPWIKFEYVDKDKRKITVINQ